MEATITPKEFRLLQRAEEALRKNGISLETFTKIDFVNRGQHSKIEFWVSKRDLKPEKDTFEKANSDFKETTNGSELLFAGIRTCK